MENFFSQLPAIHKAGYPIILAFVSLSLIISFFVGSLWFVVLLILLNTAVCYFFRDPLRVVPVQENLVLSPADGVVSFINHDVKPPEELGMHEQSMVQISIYLSVMNVHVNRMPTAGVVKNSVYSPGRFRNMYFARNEGGIDYEKHALTLEDKKGRSFAVVQIAGFIARRIVHEANLGAEFVSGQRFGIICFGSRVDIYIPKREGLVIMARSGQTMVGGETILAVFDGNEAYDTKIA